MPNLPQNIPNIQALENSLSSPTPRLIEDMQQIKGDMMILGVGGKMGPSLAKLAKRAIDAAGNHINIYAVSRFSNPKLKKELEAFGIQCIAADLLDEEALGALPKVPNIIFMAGMKFGSTGQEARTWAMNTYLPGRVAAHFPDSRIIAFSTGNVYPFTEITSAGPDESSPTGPIGEYAQSCLGRERMFQHFSELNQTPMLLFRLNYAIDLRYGVLLDVAKAVWENRAIDLSMGHVNVIWQGDANEYALRALLHCSSPPNILNITGPELISIQWLAEKFGETFQKHPTFINESSHTALLNNAAKSFHLFGYPSVSLNQMIEWTASWVMSGGDELGKPTHFQQRKGEF